MIYKETCRDDGGIWNTVDDTLSVTMKALTLVEYNGYVVCKLATSCSRLVDILVARTGDGRRVQQPRLSENAQHHRHRDQGSVPGLGADGRQRFLRCSRRSWTHAICFNLTST